MDNKERKSSSFRPHGAAEGGTTLLVMPGTLPRVLSRASMCEDPPKPVQAPLLKRIIIALLPGEFDEKLNTAVSCVPAARRTSGVAGAILPVIVSKLQISHWKQPPGSSEPSFRTLSERCRPVHQFQTADFFGCPNWFAPNNLVRKGGNFLLRSLSNTREERASSRMP